MIEIPWLANLAPLRILRHLVLILLHHCLPQILRKPPLNTRREIHKEGHSIRTARRRTTFHIRPHTEHIQPSDNRYLLYPSHTLTPRHQREVIRCPALPYLQSPQRFPAFNTKLQKSQLQISGKVRTGTLPFIAIKVFGVG